MDPATQNYFIITSYNIRIIIKNLQPHFSSIAKSFCEILQDSEEENEKMNSRRIVDERYISVLQKEPAKSTKLHNLRTRCDFRDRFKSNLLLE